MLTRSGGRPSSRLGLNALAIGTLAAASLAGAIAAREAAAQDVQGVSGLIASGVSAGSAPLVEVTGGRIRGAKSPHNGRIYVFKGIPYGADTGGKNRFHPPRPVEPWSGVRDATHLGNRCPQPDYPPPPFMQEEGQDLDKSPMSEDCLYLNVWTPALGDGGKRPVMVWFHGGGFAQGSGGSFRYDGTNLAAYQNVVLVTTNQRLNVFGYLNLAGLGNAEYADASNVGVLDMVQSLEWVHENIAKFGGDPNNVTIFGQSGGGGKVTTLMAVPAAKGLFEKVIAQSGLTSIPDAPPPDPHAALAKLGVGDDLGALASLGTDDVMKAMGAGRWGPWMDGKVIPAPAFAGQAPAISADVPLMTGWTQTETTFFSGPVGPLDDAALEARVEQLARGDKAAAHRMIAEYRRVYPEAPNNLLYLSMAADRMMGRRALGVAKQKAAQGGAPVYVYHFRGMTEVRNLMAPHTLDIAYDFDNLELSTRTNGEVTAEKQTLADLMSTAWASFARTGVPSAPGLPTWRPFEADHAALMVLGPRPHMITGSEGLLKVLAGHETR